MIQSQPQKVFRKQSHSINISHLLANNLTD